MKKQIFIIDTSAILSGKPINLGSAIMLTTTTVSEELKPGGRDYRTFQFLLEKGLTIRDPSDESRDAIQKIANESGDIDRLSTADIDILALAFELHKDIEYQTSILTDDYSIQNVASILNISYQRFSQKGIIKKFKWRYQCPGCKKRFTKSIKICPVCGTETKLSRIREKQ